MPSLDGRMATVEQIARDMRDDLGMIMVEQTRTRDRLHKLEATAAGLVLTADQAARAAERSQRRLEVHLQGLTVAIAFAGVILPIAVAFH